jgi:branched-chain amino acid transport system substrate-binding protein
MVPRDLCPSHFFSLPALKQGALVMIGTAISLANFTINAKLLWPNCMFLTVSFVGTKVLSTELGNNRTGVIVTQVVPPPLNNDAALWVEQEGYMVGKLLLELVKRSGSVAITRMRLLDTAYDSGTFELVEGESHVGPFRRSTSANCSQGIDFVHITVRWWCGARG